MEKPYIVYLKVQENGCITAVNSSAFLTDPTGWLEIDSGYGDRYHHAQGNYLPESIMTDGGAYRYKLVDGKPAGCTQEELQEQEAALLSSCEDTQETRIKKLEEQNALLTRCILELSEILYA